MQNTSRCNRSRRNSRGQTLVEFVLVLPLLLVIVVGVFDFGRAIFTYNTISNAARTATRVAIVDQNTTSIVSAARQNAVGVVFPDFTPTYACSPPYQIGCVVTVQITTPFEAATPLIGALVGPISLEASSAMPIERVYQSP